MNRLIVLLFLLNCMGGEAAEVVYTAIVKDCPDTSICQSPPLGDSSDAFYLITYEINEDNIFRTILGGSIQNGDSTIGWCAQEPEYWISKSPGQKLKKKIVITGISEVHSMWGGKMTPPYNDTLSIRGKSISDKYGIRYQRSTKENLRKRWCKN